MDWLYSFMLTNNNKQRTSHIKVALVDDDAVTRFLIGESLLERKIEVFECGSAEALFELLEKQRIDVIVLDLVLPQIDGLDALSFIRKHSDVGVIMISSKANANQRLDGLRMGADDFIRKPVATEELVFKVESLAARVNHQQGQTKQQILSIGNCRLVVQENLIGRLDDKTSLKLTPSEQQILVLLLQNMPHICNRKSLIQCVSRSEISLSNDRSLDTLISRIRGKLKKLGCNASINAIRGQGYRLKIN